MKLFRALLLASALCLVAPAVAAADSIEVTIGPELTESVAAPVDIDWTATGTDSRSASVYIKATGGGECPISGQAASSEGDLQIFDRYDAPDQAGNHYTISYTPTRAGTYVACGYLRNSGTGEQVPKVKTVQPFGVRVARATLSLSQASADPGGRLSFRATYRSEAQRQLFIRYRPAGAPCASSLVVERDNSQDALSFETVNGAGTKDYSFSAPQAPGQYVQCGYIQTDSSDTTPDVVATSAFTVNGDAPPGATGTTSTPVTPTTPTTSTVPASTTTASTVPLGPTPCQVAGAALTVAQQQAGTTLAARTAALSAKRAAQARSEAALRSYRRARHSSASRRARLYRRYTARKTAYRRALAGFSAANRANKAQVTAVSAAQSSADSAC